MLRKYRYQTGGRIDIGLAIPRKAQERQKSFFLIKLYWHTHPRTAPAVRRCVDQINHPRRGASCIDWIQQKTFVLRKQTDRFALGYRSKTPNWRRPLIQSSV